MAVFWEDTSVPPFELAEAAIGLCRLIWVIGWSGSAVAFPTRVLRRLGEFLDVGAEGQGDDIAQRLRPLNPAGVVCFSDGPHEVAAATAGALGLPFHSRQTARNVSDKWAQRLALQSAGIAVPGFYPLQPSTFLASPWLPESTVSFPCVLKPRRGSGSRCVFLVRNEAELMSAIRSCDDEELILEEYLEGPVHPALSVGADFVSVETVMLGGCPHHLGLTGRFDLAPPFRETGSFFPSDLSLQHQSAVRALASEAIAAVGIRHGVVHTEIKMTPSGPCVVEINARVGGNIPGLLARVGASPMLVSALRLALSLEVLPPIPSSDSLVAFTRWVTAPPTATVFEGAEGLAEVRALPGVESIRFNRSPGDRLDVRIGSFGYILAIDGAVGSHEELRSLICAIDSKLTLSYTQHKWSAA